MGQASLPKNPDSSPVRPFRESRWSGEHRCWDPPASRLRQGGADPAQVPTLLGYASLDTSARYFRAGTAETAAVVERRP